MQFAHDQAAGGAIDGGVLRADGDADGFGLGRARAKGEDGFYAWRAPVRIRCARS
jgi:hypothetical protein